jgi:hypothetical protein
MLSAVGDSDIKIIFQTEQKPLLNIGKIKNSKSLSRPIEVYIKAI